MLELCICDDSVDEVKRLNKVVKTYLIQKNKEYNISYFTSGEGLLKSAKQFDIVFLDIEMAGMNGIDTAKLLCKKNLETKIIYVTSYKEYQSFAFQVHAFQYIIKPFVTEDILHVLEEAITYIEARNENNTISLITNEGVVKTKITDIYYLEFSDRKVHVIMENDIYTMNRSLNEIYEKVKSHHFCMSHKSFVVNFYNIHNIKGYDIEMKNGDIVPLAQKKAVNFKEAFHEFLQNTYYLL